MNKTKAMKVAIVIVVLLIPIIYSFFYLKAFWDPYGNIDNIPVAIVNLDEGSETENLGQDLVDNLLEKDVLKLDTLSEDEANTSLVNENYYAVLTIPKDFTKTIEGAENKDRQVVTITYSPNQKSNYLASQIINKVVTNVQKELTSQINEETVATLAERLNQIPDELQAISDGAGQIQTGNQELSDGLHTLNEGTSELESSYSKFNDGISSAYSGSTELNNGINSLNSGIESLHSGISQLQEKSSSLSQVTSAVDTLASGASSLNAGINSYVSGVNALNNNVETLINAIIAYGNSNSSALATDANLAQIYGIAQAIQKSGAINTLSASSQSLTLGASNLNSGLQQFKSQTSSLSQLTSAISQLEQGASSLEQGATAVASGSQSLNSGMSTLDKSSQKIEDAISTLSDGTASAASGAEQLQDGVDTFKEEIDSGIESSNEQLENLDGLSDYSASPVEINEEDYAEVDTYGQSFAPFFMSISLWIGAFIIFIVLYYDPADRFKILGRSTTHRFIRVGLYAILAMAQALIMAVLLKWALGFSVTNPWLYYGSCVLVSMVFFSILQFFMFNFGDVGKLIALVLLILQLASSGGTFPIETVPEFFQKLNVIMPMTYSIKLFREAIISIDMPVLIQNLEILITILAVFTLGTLASDIFKGIKKKIIHYKENKKGMIS